jgi:hypothetical protein
MDNIVFMEIINRPENLLHKLCCHFLTETVGLLYTLKELSTLAKLCHYYIASRLLVHVEDSYYVRMIEPGQNIHLFLEQSFMLRVDKFPLHKFCRSFNPCRFMFYKFD